LLRLLQLLLLLLVLVVRGASLRKRSVFLSKQG
jgi:hypothetical protein